MNKKTFLAYLVTIHVRGDDKALLLTLSGTASSRDALVEALAPGLCINVEY